MKNGLLFTFAAIQALIAILAWFGVTPSILRQGGAALPHSVATWIGIVLFAGSLGTSAFGLYRLSRSSFNPDASLTLVADKTFRNERVELDGKEYRNCKFINVTLVYNARGPVKLVSNAFEGSPALVSDNPSVSAAFAFASLLMEDLGIQFRRVPK
jgi:hypothetical protein